MIGLNWPHKFSNGITLGSNVFYKHKDKWFNCLVQYELYFGEPMNLRVLPCRSSDKIGKFAGMSAPISQEDILNIDIVRLIDNSRSVNNPDNNFIPAY